jgi:hypothetical protein
MAATGQGRTTTALPRAVIAMPFFPGRTDVSS